MQKKFTNIVCLLIIISVQILYLPIGLAQSFDPEILETESGGILLDDHEGSPIEADHSVGTSPISESGSVLQQEPSPIPQVHVVINEIFWTGSDLSSADEWVELFVVSTGSSQVLSLDGWRITRLQDAAMTPMFSLDGLQVQQGQYVVLSNYDAAHSILSTEPDSVSTALSLVNTKLQLQLVNAEGVVMDTVDDGIGVPMAGGKTASGVYRSMERIHVELDGTQEAAWQSATTMRGLDAGAKALGTPGYLNASVEPPDVVAPVSAQAFAYQSDAEWVVWWSDPVESDIARHMLYAEPQSLVPWKSVQHAQSSTSMSGTGSVAPMLWYAREDVHGNASTRTPVRMLQKGDLFIRSILPNPDSTDAGEWIELGWTGSGAMPIDGLRLGVGAMQASLTADGTMLLESGSVLRVDAAAHHLRLANARGEVSLWAGSVLVDSVEYPSLPRGVVWYHTNTDVPWIPYCRSIVSEYSTIELQSGSVAGAAPHSVNVTAQVREGDRCFWDFGDGYTYDGCNPPSHAFRQAGEWNISLNHTDYCGNTVTRTLPIVVTSNNAPLDASRTHEDSCTPMTFSGITVSEVLPNPSGDEAQGEWIELYNETLDRVHLCGWSLDDQEGGSAPYGLDALWMEPLSYVVVPRSDSRIVLQNDVETVRLFRPLPQGGSGVWMQVHTHDVPEDFSWSRRDDGYWLASQFPTPAASNTFALVTLEHAQPMIEIAAALPNPFGKDEDQEWVELQNRTMRPQWLDGWVLETGNGQKFALDGRVIARKETIRIVLRRTSFSLRNSDGLLRLKDQTGMTRSVLHWNYAKEGIPQHPPSPEHIAVDSIDPIGNGEWRVRRFENGKLVYSDRIQFNAISMQGIPSFDSYNNQNEFIIKALSKNKKIELLKYSIFGKSPVYSLRLDGADMAQYLLQSGRAFAAAPAGSEVYDHYAAFEQEAQNSLRGIWTARDTDLLVRDHRENERRLQSITDDGLKIAGLPESGLIQPGLQGSIHASLPARIRYEWSTGESGVLYESGSFLFHADADLYVYAHALDTKGDTLGEEVLLQRSYVQAKQHYERCIRIGEVYPSPRSGEQEWVELHNACDNSVNLTGWSIDDVPGAGSKPAQLPVGLQLHADQRLLLSGSLLPIILNNAGDTVTVYAPDGTVQDSILYKSVGKGKSIALWQERYCSTTEPSPLYDAPCIDSVSADRKAKTPSTAKNLKKLNLQFVYDFPWHIAEIYHTNNADNHFTEGLNIKYGVENLYSKSYYTTNVLLVAFFSLILYLIFSMWQNIKIML